MTRERIRPQPGFEPMVNLWVLTARISHESTNMNMLNDHIYCPVVVIIIIIIIVIVIVIIVMDT